MKKNYIKPRTTTVTVMSQSLLNITSNPDGTLNAGGNKGPYTGGQLSRRGGSDWEDEE